MVVLILISFLFAPIYKVYADTKEDTNSKKINESVLEQLEKLDLDKLQEYFNSLSLSNGESVKERLIEFITKNDVDYASFGKELLQVLFQDVIDLLPYFTCIIAIALLSGVLSAVKSDTGGNSSSSVVFFITYAAALIPLTGVLVECFQACTDCVFEMRKQAEIIFPLMLTMITASGGIMTASICQPAVGFFATNIISIISSVVFPLCITIIIFSMAGNMTTDIKINKFTAFFKSINKWILGICVSVFGLFLTLQGITASVYDGVVRRAAKYAIGTGIPIVGGFLSGGFDLAVAGSILIKNSLGSMGVFLLISVLFKPLVMLIAVNVLLRLTAAVTQPFADNKISDFLGETADNLQYCTAGLLIVAFLYFLTIVLMIYSTEALI